MHLLLNYLAMLVIFESGKSLQIVLFPEYIFYYLILKIYITYVLKFSVLGTTLMDLLYIFIIPFLARDFIYDQ